MDDRPGASDTPPVSICMPTYNDARFLRESLSSVLGQTYRDFELVVSDDASTDETADVVASFADSRIRYHRNEHNLGLFGNMNRCIELAQGELVGIYHSDDVYEPNMVEEEVRFLAAHPDVGAVFTLDTWIDSEGRRFGQTRLPPDLPDPSHLTLTDVVPVLMRHKNRILRCPTFMARSSVLAQVGRFEPTRYSIQGDLDYYLRLLQRHPIGIVAKPLMRYRQDTSQVSTGYQRLRTFEEHFFGLIDRSLAGRDLGDRVDEATRAEYAFHRYDDRTRRAANLVILDDNPAAWRLLAAGSFPWSTFANGVTRRKLRVVLLSGALRAGLMLHAGRLMAPALSWTEYGRWGHPDGP